MDLDLDLEISDVPCLSIYNWCTKERVFAWPETPSVNRLEPILSWDLDSRGSPMAWAGDVHEVCGYRRAQYMGRGDGHYMWLSTYDSPRPLVQDVLDP